MDVEIMKPVIGSQHSTKKEGKKSKKPLMEKMRRARINDSLNELKSLVLEAMKKDISRYSKMEKADILEMTVRYLRSLHAEKPLHLKQRQDDAAMAKYRAGFNECVSKVTRFVMTADNISVPVRTQLLSHLASSCQKQADTSQTTSDKISCHQQTPVSPFPAIPHVVGANAAISGGNSDARFPSPPSSPQERKFLPFAPSASPIVLSNGFPAFIVPNDALHLLPFTLPNAASTGFDASLWRPW